MAGKRKKLLIVAAAAAGLVADLSGRLELDAGSFRLRDLELTAPRGRINLPLRVAGTADASVVALNQVYLERLGQRYVRQRVEQEIGKALGRLFGAP